MHTLFFGGMSQYKLDANNNLIQDNDVPFVKTISKVSRFGDGSMTESGLDIEMPTLLGSGAEFIPLNDNSIYLTNDILDINTLQDGATLVGYIFGGIESTQENIFFINNGTQSSASNLAFKVYITKSSLSLDEIELNVNNIYNLSVFPNPSKGSFTVAVFIPNTDKSTLDVIDLLGKKIKSIVVEQSIGKKSISIDITKFASGEYILVFTNNSNIIEKKIIKL